MPAYVVAEIEVTNPDGYQQYIDPALASITQYGGKAVALAGAEIVIGAMPSIHARAVYAQALPSITKEMVFVSATKGLEPETHLRMSLVLAQVLAKAGIADPSRRIARPQPDAPRSRSVPSMPSLKLWKPPPTRVEMIPFGATFRILRPWLLMT